MRKGLSILVASLIYFSSPMVTDYSTAQPQKEVKTTGDFDGNGKKENAVYEKGRIEVEGLTSIYGVSRCDSLYVVKGKNKQDALVMLLLDGKREKAEYDITRKQWTTMPYKK